MENPEQILLELNSLERGPLEELTKGLEEYLVFVARTGNTVFPWTKIKPVVRLKLESIIADFSKDMPEEQVGVTTIPITITTLHGFHHHKRHQQNIHHLYQQPPPPPVPEDA